MTALYHFYLITTTRKEWIMCAVYNEEQARARLDQLRKDNPKKHIIMECVK